MRYPDEFYFSEAKGQEIYTRTPTSNLSVGKLIKSEPCWRASTLARIEKQKTLVLADWTAPYWSPEKIEQVKSVLAELLAQGYLIYIWQNYELIPIYSEQLSALDEKDVRNAMTLTPAPDIIKAAVMQHKLISDQILLIDDYWIEHLLSEKKEPGPRILRTSELKNLSPDALALLIQISNAARPKLAKIIHDEFSESANSNVRFLQAQWPGIQIEYDYTTLVHDKSGDYAVQGQFTIDKFVIKLDAAQLEKLRSITFCHSSPAEYVVSILGATTNLKQLKLTNCTNLAATLKPTLTEASLSKLESIYLASGNLSARGDISAENLQALLQAAQNLKKLHLSFCKNFTGRLKLNADSLQKLEYINFSHSDISPENFRTFLQAAPNLKTLELPNCKNLTGELEFIANSLSKLESIHLSAENISLQNIQPLLKVSQSLKHMKLFQCDNFSGELELMENCLSALESIDLTLSKISLQNLQVFLKAAPNLKTLNLSYCSNLAKVIELSKVNLSKLESINLSSSNISAQSLQALLQAAPNLKTLNLPNCTNLADTLILTEASLSQLEYLNLSGSEISAENLKALLQAEPNLKTLNLGSCRILAGEIHFDKDSLLQLKSLDLSRSNISTENLKALLQAAPNLKTLNLGSSRNLAGVLELKKDSLSKLESINLSHSNISATSLQALLQAAPNLKTLDLRSCDNLADILRLTEDSLLQLKSLDLSRSNISAASLQVLLQAAPNLKRLNLSECSNLSGLLELDKDSLSQRESINLSGSNISAASLQALLQAAPNLKTLDLSYCNNLATTLTLTPASLLKLESINLSGRNISAASLQALLQAAPNLNQQTKDMIEKICRERESTRLHTSALAQSGIFGPSPSEQDLGRTQASTPVNRTHNPQDMKYFVPNQKPFAFKGTNKTQNQGMIIEKLSQYLTLTQQRLHLIPRIQDGICNALSHYFLTHLNWPQFIEMTLAWDGQPDINPKLQVQFDDLFDLIHQHQLTTQAPEQYIGDGLAAFLKEQRRPWILKNPWHAIAIKPAENGNWHLYDPNYVTGSLETAPQDLLASIHKSIGSIVSVEADASPNLCAISDRNQFIEHGGLLALCQCANTQEMLSQLPQQYSYSEAALDGLLLRDTKGTPAWVRGLASPNSAIIALTQKLKAQLEQQNTEDSVAQLAKSIEALPPKQKGECITRLVQADAHGQDALIKAIRASGNREHFSKALETWDKAAAHVSKPLEYFQQCCTNPPSKQLIELDSSQHVDTLGCLLEEYANTVKRPVFYIDHPDDLICSAPWIRKNPDNTGTLCKGPGGPLYEFFQAHQHDAPLLIVNYRFNADDIVRFNGLLDKEPHADGTPLPKNTQIIGLMNRNKPDCYQGADFYSRFDCTQLCPLMLDALKPRKIVDIAAVTAAAKSDSTIINLYHAADWEDRLLGRWVLNGDTLSFEEGELLKAIAAGKTIEIQNGLWGDEKFERFWQQAMTIGVRHADRIIQIPEGINITCPETDAYAWGKWLGIANISTALLESPDEILNPSNLANFLERYELKDGRLCKEPGLIAAPNHSTFNVLLTRSLSDDAWAMLLDQCQQQQVRLNIQPAPGVELPAVFQHSVIKADEVDFRQDITNGLIISSDIDTTVAMINSNEDYWVIDVSECTPADLLYKLDGKLNPVSMKFEFSQTDSALTTALAAEQKIVLKGHFSAELMDALTPILLNRENQLILISDDRSIGSFMPQRYTHAVSVKEKLACLGDDVSIQHKIIAEKPLSTLKAIHANPGDDPWIGMYELKGPTQASTAKLAHATSAEFTQGRIDKVNEILSQKPYVFLTGLSGVGKSTFVERVFCTEKDTLYLTEDNIERWAMDTSEKRKILFIDEANLSPRQWSEFEGLYQNPPHILVNGNLHPLRPNHQVIFAGNPVNYGDERSLAPFFQRHGNAVLFEPLPPALIAEQILTPVFQNTDIDPGPIVRRILGVYGFICECSTTDILISPRELQMMALLTVTRAQKYHEQDINAIAEHFTYQLAINLLPIEKRREFDAHFKPKTPITIALPETTDQAFHVTASRQAVSQQLNDLLALRNWRREEATLSPQQQTGGLGGIIIEGEPGIGKSQLVIATLIASKYEQEHDLTTPSSKENPFYIMPVSMPLSEKENLLIKAFNEGAIVMIDEINSSPMMERLLNDLLMGKNPKRKPDDVVKPGFMIIGTQNPVTMAGRRAASTALLRRVISATLPEYEPDEIGHILKNKGVPAPVASDMMTAYESQRAHAIKNLLSPVPNFRHLMTLVDYYLESRRTGLALEQNASLGEEEKRLPSLGR